MKHFVWLLLLLSPAMLSSCGSLSNEHLINANSKRHILIFISLASLQPQRPSEKCARAFVHSPLTPRNKRCTSNKRISFRSRHHRHTKRARAARFMPFLALRFNENFCAIQTHYEKLCTLFMVSGFMFYGCFMPLSASIRWRLLGRCHVALARKWYGDDPFEIYIVCVIPNWVCSARPQKMRFHFLFCASGIHNLHPTSHQAISFNFQRTIGC